MADGPISSKREILLIMRSEPTQTTVWDTIERFSKILSIAAIPVILAISSTMIQQRVQEQSVSKEYVQLAVSILQESDPKRVGPGLRSWATDLLNSRSPNRLGKDVIAELKSGSASLPKAVSLNTTCIANTKQLESGWEQFVMDKGKKPPVKVKMSDLSPDYLRSIPKCPAGGEYIVLDDGRAICTVHGRYN